MSNLNYISDLYKSLDFPDHLFDFFIPFPYDNSHSCFKSDLDKYGHPSKFMRLRSIHKDSFICPHCGVVIDHHESKGLRKISLSHIANGHQRFIIEVEY